MTTGLSDAEIVLGVTGSIAAYKACEIASRLVERGVRVTPALTRAATKLIGPASLEAIAGRRAITRLFEPFQNPEVEHIAVATRANLFLIAPATADFLAKAAHGLADDWLSTALLATQAPTLFAPAMNTNMYDHPATQANIQTLRERGCHFVGPGAGRLACGAEGVGRMIDPMTIVEAALPLASTCADLAGRRVVITSGGTREPIDPVRFLGNRSSGKMGRALAFEALLRGAAVTVVTGPAETPLPYGAEAIHVETAREMAEAVVPLARQADVVIAAAAVGDYRIEHPLDRKRKRDGAALTLSLVENADIIGEIGRAKREGQVIVGFAAETEDMVANAAAKVQKKNLDLVLANRVGTTDSGFGLDALEAAILGRDEPVEELGCIPKDEVARRLFDRIIALLA